MLMRPEASEYDPFYATYVDAVPEGDIVATLDATVDETAALLATCSREHEEHRYAPDKWSIRELVGHLADAERLYAYRAVHFARGAGAPLPGMDAVAWAKRSNSGERPLASLTEEFRAVRTATVALFSGFDAETWSLTGLASGRTFSVRALAFIIAGHEIHHRKVLAERYLAKR